MMDDTNHLDAPREVQPGEGAQDTPPQPETVPATAATAQEPTPGPTEASAAVMKFKSCRWRSDPDAGEFCNNGEFLMF
jgi:hypothetical protein